MTLEEMAEERKADYGEDLCCLCRECEVEAINPCQHKKDAMYGYKDGFLAGLKAGRPQWNYLEDGKFPENYKRVLITVLDDEGKRVVVSGMFVTKVINRNKKTKLIRYWLYDSADVFITSGSPGECSKPIAWMPFPEPPEERE